MYFIMKTGGKYLITQYCPVLPFLGVLPSPGRSILCQPCADLYPWESFGSRIGFCLWCHNDGAWLQGADGEPYQKPCWNPAKLHQLVAICPVQFQGHVQWWWAESHNISFSWSRSGSCRNFGLKIRMFLSRAAVIHQTPNQHIASQAAFSQGSRTL